MTSKDDRIDRITEYRFHKKHMRSNPRENPKKVIPSRFAVVTKTGEKIVLCYHSLVIEGPKSLVARYSNRYFERNNLPKIVIVKYQLKFQGYSWSPKLKAHIQKRYTDPDKGDELCLCLDPSPRICKYYGTYVLVADPRQEAPDRWDDYIKTKGVPEIAEEREAFVIQLFEEIRGCDLYNFLCQEGPSEIVDHSARFNPLIGTQILQDIAEGLDNMHSKNIYHSDLKPENVVLYKQSRNDPTRVIGNDTRATIIDFDFSARTCDDRIKRGTPRYLSPEYIQAYRDHRDLPSLGRYGCEFDMWAFGAMLWTIFFGSGKKLYFSSYSTDHLKNPAINSKIIQYMLEETDYNNKLLLKRTQKVQLPIPPEAQSHVIQLTRACLAYDPLKRPTAGAAYHKLNEIKGIIQKHSRV